ncbi:MAG: hypothetical protein A2Z27_05780 [candidate division Zixibacteria bacterium RBG_16_50_21]|nr:MAG: hypothetical protein A2Z27_05780 [candidate division Zixibacteria bacterium RBG_16_50_21]
MDIILGMKDYYLERAGLPPTADLLWENGSAIEEPESRLVLMVRQTVESLPFLQKEFVWKFYYQGLTYPCIASELHISLKAAMKLHYRVKKRLKRELGGYVAVTRGKPLPTPPLQGEGVNTLSCKGRAREGSVPKEDDNAGLD